MSSEFTDVQSASSSILPSRPCLGENNSSIWILLNSVIAGLRWENYSVSPPYPNWNLNEWWAKEPRWREKRIWMSNTQPKWQPVLLTSSRVKTMRWIFAASQVHVRADTQLHSGTGPEINYVGLIRNRIWAGENFNSDAKCDSGFGSGPQAFQTLWPRFHHHSHAGSSEKASRGAGRIFLLFLPASLDEWGETLYKVMPTSGKDGFKKS